MRIRQTYRGILRCRGSVTHVLWTVWRLGYIDEFRHPKVKNLGFPAGSDKDVGGLNVAVDDALFVCRLQAVGNLNRQCKQLSPSTRALICSGLDPVPEGLSS